MSAAPSGRPAISGSTALVGVLGDPVRHSLSPAMHNAALQELGLDWVYLALPAPAPELAGVVRALEALDCRGLNVTLPHKQAVASLCADRSPLARRLGAVNTLVRRAEGGWWGTNTDVEGFLAPLREQGLAGGGRRAVVLGCGGSARAVVAGLIDRGLAAVQVAGRRPEVLQTFVAEFAGEATEPEALSWDDGPALSAALAAADLVVNTTPVGMASGQDPAAAERCPLRPQELAALAPGTCVYDLIYTPRPSRLLREAAERGCSTLDGLEMLVQQGAASLRLWTGLPEVPVERMRAAALARLQSP
jgi:shikimate dehydrogenase